jgi:hypothetical protein
MRIPRFQFTIRRLIVLIAVCGVCFALLRTPLGVSLLCFLTVFPGSVLPGLLIERARGGPGMIGGALSVSTVTSLLFVVSIFHRQEFSLDGGAIISTLVLTSLVACFAFVFGLLLSGVLYLVFEFASRTNHQAQHGGIARVRGKLNKRRPRLRFTIRQLIGLIAICAVAFALLRTPFEFLVVAFGFVVPGFLIGRARGGDGVIGGAISASLIAGGLTLAGSTLVFALGPSDVRTLSNAFQLVFVGPIAVSLIAFVLGTVLSTFLYMIFKLLQPLLERPLQDGSIGSIRWLDDGPVERG